jgi:hypothetical protein
MKSKRLTALLVAGTAVFGVPAAMAGLGQQIPGTNWSVSSDDSGSAANGDDPVAQCSVNGYTLSMSNNRDTDITIAKYVDKMSPGFMYIAGSSTLTDVGTATTTPFGDPATSGVAGSTLTWNGADVVVPAHDTVALHFNVTVLDRSDPNVKNPSALRYQNHGTAVLTDGSKANQNTQIRVSKTASECGIAS